ncbi:MAG: hypothetical protein OJF50_006438 [Nitrospira sp.]|nr:hypothetical protein [Nitrospira sp.]
MAHNFIVLNSCLEPISKLKICIPTGANGAKFKDALVFFLAI